MRINFTFRDAPEVRGLLHNLSAPGCLSLAAAWRRAVLCLKLMPRVIRWPAGRATTPPSASPPRSAAARWTAADKTPAAAAAWRHVAAAAAEAEVEAAATGRETVVTLSRNGSESSRRRQSQSRIQQDTAATTRRRNRRRSSGFLLPSPLPLLRQRYTCCPVPSPLCLTSCMRLIASVVLALLTINH